MMAKENRVEILLCLEQARSIRDSRYRLLGHGGVRFRRKDHRVTGFGFPELGNHVEQGSELSWAATGADCPPDSAEEPSEGERQCITEHLRRRKAPRRGDSR